MAKWIIGSKIWVSLSPLRCVSKYPSRCVVRAAINVICYTVRYNIKVINLIVKIKLWNIKDPLSIMTFQHLKSFLVVTIIWHSLIVSQWPPWLMTSVGRDIVVMSTFHSLIRHKGHHDGCRMRSRKCLPFRRTWFHLCFS